MIVKIENLVKRYGELIALDHLNLDIKKGEIFGLLGPNGSGKTTTINCMLSLLKYDKGTIEILGEEMTPTTYKVKKDIGIVMQNVAVFDELTVYENIDYFCGLYVTNKKERKVLVERAIDFVGLSDYKKFIPKKLSGGLLRRLNIACGIAHNPKLIILDEPTVAVDPQSRNHILEGIKKLNAEGATIIYTSHYMEEIEQLCTSIAIMDKGKVIAKGTKEELKSIIDLGEKITIEAFNLNENHIKNINILPNVISVDYKNNLLNIRTKSGHSSLGDIVSYIGDNKISYGKIYSEQPTLNDVFLEITGKELRD
ncbi:MULTISPECIES: ABC transporter ATP-binding protein [unclassified Clostridium]|uniref:ABC transporter ATP-binding protein n=1 Tax=unclassified Clostridium TaxID=2614128 RepID=UPI003216B54A